MIGPDVQVPTCAHLLKTATLMGTMDAKSLTRVRCLGCHGTWYFVGSTAVPEPTIIKRPAPQPVPGPPALERPAVEPVPHVPVVPPLPVVRARDAEPDQELLRTVEVARMFDVTERTVINWVAAKRLRALRTIGGHLRFRPQDIEAYIERYAI